MTARRLSLPPFYYGRVRLTQKLLYVVCRWPPKPSHLSQIPTTSVLTDASCGRLLASCSSGPPTQSFLTSSGSCRGNKVRVEDLPTKEGQPPSPQGPPFHLTFHESMRVLGATHRAEWQVGPTHSQTRQVALKNNKDERRRISKDGVKCMAPQ